MKEENALKRIRKRLRNHYQTNRVTVGPHTTNLIQDIKTDLRDGVIHDFTSGTECLTWTIPQEWTVDCAYVESDSGERVLDYDDNPLHLKSYSHSFEGSVSREAFIDHIHTDPERPEHIPYHYQWQYQPKQEQSWGFCARHELLNQLTDRSYYVNIKTNLTEGMMKVYDLQISGNLDTTIFFGAHTCHPAQVNDGILNVCLLVELFRWLSKQSSLTCNYRLIIGPEYFTAAAVLENIVKKDNLDFGFYLDMMADGEPLGFSKSYEENTYADKVARTTLRDFSGESFERGYRKLWGNDELFYDGPDYEIPTLSIGRGNFPHYHSHKDNLENCNFDQVLESLQYLKFLVNSIEDDFVPTRNYRGPLHFSSYELNLDKIRDHLQPQTEQHLQREMNGKNSIVELADQFNVSLTYLKNLLQNMRKLDLINVKTPKFGP